MTVYDPAAPRSLREAATTCRAISVEMAAVGGLVVRHFDTDRFVGPLADEYRANAGMRRSHDWAQAEEFGALSFRLEEAAAAVEAKLAAIGAARQAWLASLPQGVMAPPFAATSTEWLAGH